jgi:hypothetical protein
MSVVVKFLGCAELGVCRWRNLTSRYCTTYATVLPKEVTAPREWLEGVHCVHWRPFDWTKAQSYVSQPTADPPEPGAASRCPIRPKSRRDTDRVVILILISISLLLEKLLGILTAEI